jgi:phosphate transport system substrate-binding protein
MTLALCACVVYPATAAEPPSPLDPSLPSYRPSAQLSGKITLVGSNTMSQVASIWIDGFRQFHPNVEIENEIRGSANAVSSVINEEATFGLLSRSIHPQEVVAFEKKFGHAPTVLTPTFEPIAVFSHESNPIEGLTLQQLDAIYSTTRLRGAGETATTWGDLGLTGEWASRTITLQGRSNDTGSVVFFRDIVLAGGAYRRDLVAHRSNVDLVKGVAGDTGAIGAAGRTYMLPGVKTIPISVAAGEPFVDVSSVEAAQGRYPLIRPLQLVVNQAPDQELPTLQGEFLKYVFSRLGQEDVLRAGFQPISGRPAEIALDTVGLGGVK